MFYFKILVNESAFYWESPIETKLFSVLDNSMEVDLALISTKSILYLSSRFYSTSVRGIVLFLES